MILSTNIQDSFYKYYKTPLSGEIKPIPRDLYKRIVSGFIKFIVRKILDGFTVRLSNARSLGEISIVGKKLNICLDENGNIINAAIDGRATLDLWKNNPEAKANKQHIYHLNEHTNNISYRWYWCTWGMKVANKKLYTFISTKGPSGNSRKVARMIKDHNKEYYVEPIRLPNKIATIWNRSLKK